MGVRDQEVWLGVAGRLERNGKILVVKRTYGPTRGLWTLPGGFVHGGETLEEAVSREIREETGCESEAKAIIAVRSGVLRNGKHDTLIVLAVEDLSPATPPKPDGREISEAAFLTPEEILASPDSAEFLIASTALSQAGLARQPLNLFRDYGYAVCRFYG
ncbi:MAG: NUDIX hydrolase [Kyrpidia sp.]|nr:NUDIX hydrolase [Kyrpidia sp.]